ncbi:conserved hypothetical protein [Flavobacterium sp. 9AF]|uniref:DUF4403 family protein n=1 Tax=Flavobacterium sp. 9AF TaxID=2653142 RepID=UPI0012F355BF|nr:DUF4403 family protein [Flavobacterium sp. 9AF]VXC33269.1 conserved hypothetical protein [Flavobacterium sp. 9AF]
MKYIVSIIFVLCFFLFLISCSTTSKIEALKPPLSDDSPMVYKNKTSFISLPTEISLKDIETLLNKNMDGLIYEDNNINDDDTEMKIWKTAPIKLTEVKGEIISVIPLKIWTKVKYGTNFMGLNDTKEINLNGTITLNSKAHLYNWKLTTQSSIKDFEWSESPNIVIAGKKVPITYIINPTVSIFKSKIAKMIDEAIDASCDFKPMVLDAMEKISTPFLTNDAYEAWFKLAPVELYVTEAELKNSKITMNMGLKCTMQTMIGQQPKNTFDKNKLVLKPVKTIPNEFEVAVAAVSTYESASKVITKNFQGQEFGSGSKKVIVQKVSIWQNESKLIIALDLLGSVNGTIYLSGYPQYNTVTKEIFFDKLDYVLDTKSVLLKSANWLAQGTILRKIQENCRYSIQENLDEGKKSMATYLNNYSPMKGIFVNGTMSDFTFEKVELTNKAIIAFISTNGKMKITIDGME